MTLTTGGRLDDHDIARTLVMSSTGAYTYTAKPNVSGTDTFTYTIKDADGSPSTTTLTINVSEVQPTVNAATGTVFESGLSNGSNPNPAVITQTGTLNFSESNDTVTLTTVAGAGSPVTINQTNGGANADHRRALAR